MTDMLLQISQNPMTRRLVSRAKLPIPMPERLERLGGPATERFLEGKTVVTAGEGQLTLPIARTLAHAGATSLVATEKLCRVFSEEGSAYGRAATVAPRELADERAHALVLDATGVESVEDLRLLYDFFHPWARRAQRSGRAILLGRPADEAKNFVQAAARAALEGFTRSLAKELGGKGVTANLIQVEKGAEERASAVLRFFLSPASAFVSAQPVRVSARAKWNSQDPWTQSLSGKIAAVTGAARGIGEQTARMLAREGAHVVCVDRPEDDELLSKVARDIQGSVVRADVTDPATPERICSALKEQHGGLDIIVHNAGITRDKTLGRMSEQHWDQALAVNLTAVIRITEALLKDTLRDQGRVISLSSVAGIAGNMGQTNYAATKAGVIGFTRQLSKDLASRGITVNAVAPGFIETRMTASIPLVIREAGRRLSALGQGGLPEDVAQAITFLSTPGAAGVTGQVLRVCGGALIGA